ncbi:hypothetical protein CFD26_107574 [Aspergillus turcosus]|uniref:Uncharacterized protein n=1 Tax=Aspergillus turcosus TaxID=1245748 RepID=A0A421DDD8_9EURO|nr:hypothetical protein CFD26_107574 [Aspergillus turcosus]
MTSPTSQSTTIVETMAERRTRKFEEWGAGESLWDKAIQFPAEITREEKHKILGWPTWEEMQENTRMYLGKSVEELFQKAITSPGALTFAECRLVRDDFRVLKRMESVDCSTRKIGRARRPDLEEKWKAACAAVLSQEEKQVMRTWA